MKAAVTYPLGHKIKSALTLSAPQVLEQAQALGVVLALSNGELRARGPQAGIAELAQHIRACKPELVKLLALPPPDPELLELAMAYCDHIGAGDKARKDWHTDIEATPVEQRGELAAYLRSQLPTPKPKAMPPAVVASPSPPVPAQIWREADKADQLHYWNCAQCLAVVKSGTGKRCTTGQQLHDAYIEAASLDILPALKNGDSLYRTVMPDRISLR